MIVKLDRLFRRHRYALEKKGICSGPGLLSDVRLDLVKAYYVLAELYNRTASGVVHDFFSDYPDVASEIQHHVDSIRLHHLGFEIHEPHDIILPGFYIWTQRFGSQLGIPIRINGTLRFPASINFQERVGAYTEMMQVWVEVNKQELLIEMFDIYRPREIPGAVSARFGAVRWQQLLKSEPLTPTANVLPALLEGDRIWHYGIHVSDPDSVEFLHDRLTAFVQDKDEYKLQYKKPVLNLRDTSLHTKISNQELGFEIEFLTQNQIPTRN